MFCSKCGNENPDDSGFCMNCGASLKAGATGGGQSKAGTGLDPNVAGLLCYLFGWVSGLIFFLIEKEDRFVRFHAMQSIALSVCLMVLWFVIWILVLIISFIPYVGFLAFILWAVVGIVTFVLWIMLMIKAYQGQTYKLPFLGDFAEKQI